MSAQCDQTVSELLELNQRLLDSIHQQDWTTYTQICTKDLTAYEPEALGHLVKGLEFHKTYFDLEPGSGSSKSTISSPDVRLLGSVAVVCFIRLVQATNAEGETATFSSEETRIWEQQDGTWKHVHFHRSPCNK